MTAASFDAIAPLTWSEAHELLQGTAVESSEPSIQLARGHALLAAQSYDLARDHLRRAAGALPPGPPRARAKIDLIQLAYYLADRQDVVRLAAEARDEAGGEPLLIADLYLGLSLCAIAENDARRAIDAARFAEDALRAAPASAAQRLVAARIHRQLAHVLAQAADYVEARRASKEAQVLDAPDFMEDARTMYTAGFVAWMSGDFTEALAAWTKAEQALRATRSALWRWVLFCLAQLHGECGEHVLADRCARQSGFDAPEELANLAILRGDLGVARKILANARPAAPAEIPFRDAVEGILLLREGNARGSARMLARSHETFRACGLTHFAIGCALHRSFAEDHLVRGCGRAPAVRALRELGARGGATFAWYHPGTAAWLVRVADGDPDAELVAHRLVPGRAASLSVRASEEDLVARCRAHDLTWREIEIVRLLRNAALSGISFRSRRELAAHLSVAPSTLRVHLSRIRHKLSVTRRGDAAVLRALDAEA